MSMSTYDALNISNIIAGNGDWFNAQLLRLMAKADKSNLAKLGSAFPEEFAYFCTWKYGGIPIEYARIDVIKEFVNSSTNFIWLGEGGRVYKMIISTSGRDF